jgi:hypothetical protein
MNGGVEKGRWWVKKIRERRGESWDEVDHKITKVASEPTQKRDRVTPTGK